MTSPGEERLARVAAAAIPGCQHVLAGGVPCQDAALTRVSDGRAIIAVSDGHGDPMYTHSDEGARIAVAVVVDALAIILDRLADGPTSRVPPFGDHEARPPSAAPRLQSTQETDIISRPPFGGSATTTAQSLVAPLKRRIAFEWNRRVKHHARMVAARDGSALLWPDEVTGDWDEKVKPYGCTIVAAAFGEGHAIWVRLGDGEALAVDQQSARRVFPGADKSMGQATYSFSMRNAVEHIQVEIETRACELAVVATDGVADQYDVDPSFEDEWGTKMLERIRTKGFSDAMMDLPRFLGTIARDGDDCSVALALLGEQ